MDRSVLIVTPFFAPQNHAAVFRAYKLAKYLPQFGWKPTVLTVDRQYEFNEDPDLLPSLPEEVEIVKAPYVEPTLRGIRMALGGRDRSFKGLKTACNGNGQRNDAHMGASSPARGLYHYLLENWVHTPDSYWTWAGSATSLAMKLAQQRCVDILFTTAPPFSSLLIGNAVRKQGIKWVADFRDPIAYTKQLSSRAPRIYHRQRKTIEDTFRHADAITMAAASMASIYRDMLGPQPVEPIFIPTGIDYNPDSWAPVEQGKHPYLLFAGEVLPEFDGVFWQTFAAAVANESVRRTAVKLLIVGTLALNRPRLTPILDRFGLHQQVEFLDQMPQRKVYRLLQGARAGLLIPGINSRWWTNAAKMTDFIGMRKPIVAVVPDPSEARTALTRSRLGVFLDGPLEQRTQTLTDFLLGRHPMHAPDDEECERYTVRRQVQSFVEIFESLANAKKMSATAK